MTVWAFLAPSRKDFDYCERSYRSAMQKLTQSVQDGKSRFGWSYEDKDDLRDRSNWNEEDWNRCWLQLFLLDVRKGDWIVHVNLPDWGECIAVQVLDKYSFDDGLDLGYGPDFRHCFKVDASTIIEFERNDPNVLPSVNLRPRYRYHRIYDEEAFSQTRKNLIANQVELDDGQTGAEYHLKEATAEFLESVTRLIHKMHRGKKLEAYLAKVIRKVPGVVSVEENGLRVGTDHGADLIVTMMSSFGRLQLEQKIIVQVKSWEDTHEEIDAVHQVETGIRHFSGTAGMIITTAECSEELENEVNAVSEKLKCSIDLLAHEDVAKLVIKHAPELVFNLDLNS